MVEFPPTSISSSPASSFSQRSRSHVSACSSEDLVPSHCMQRTAHLLNFRDCCERRRSLDFAVSDAMHADRGLADAPWYHRPVPFQH